MPDEREPSEEEVGEIVRSIEEGRDAIAVPEEMLVEPESPPPPAPRSLYAQIV